MKMNETVARIVDLMFENAEMTDEVAALRDEVMNNCQERFNDLVDSGVSEDDAIAAVVESLRGMEDVIGQYSKRSRRTARPQYQAPYEPQPQAEYTVPQEEEDIPAGGERDLVFSAQELHRIEVNLVNEDVELEESDDGMYHVRWDSGERETISVHAEGGTLKVSRLPGSGNAANGKRTTVCVKNRGGNGHIYIDGDDAGLDATADAIEGVGGMLEGLGRALGRMFSSAKRAFDCCDVVTICIPHSAMPHVRLQTVSGDLDVTNVALAELSIVTTSGDVTVSLREEESMQRMEARSTSGDIDVTAWADYGSVGSTSGDVEAYGRYKELNAHTISGDVTVQAEVARLGFKAVSGDADLTLEGEELREINGSTVSGDIDVDLPMGIGSVAFAVNSRAGDVTTRYSTNAYGPTVTGSITSMSGDIVIR